ncbi:co-chaperone GroES [Sediminispirochaeta smaragdinae]|jgi:chaperonin GroES|uniref:Co-chaperonin GroES n=1 Tax=Sediminispirochaeta smaragdinae (strain DSM 11293 / JCM 15392 / SEBR 4228) TaxID=573413 RepID=E1R675_SEDSS|nr:co-chaperone GroES [Sediminispirochaeta smaragdinae]ADK80840.1 Chaperonin Cpn10 [Sediminispirochaeta smaragdinae DSM 11293]
MKIKPLGDRVLVKLESGEEKTAGGIFIPQTAQEKTQTGVVVEIGDDETIKVKAGDKVMYDKYAGTQIKVDGEEHLLLRFSDILAVIG